jgi:hypothetical protein
LVSRSPTSESVAVEGKAIDAGSRGLGGRSWFHRVSWFAGLCLLSLALFLLRPWYGSNLGVVDPGRVIRAAQPTQQLHKIIQGYKLASILNLRGGSHKDRWYVDEVREAQNSGVAFFDLTLSATRRPTRSELLRLIDFFESCPYPLLIHCKSGADRTGMAAAVYRMVRLNEPPDKARGAFSLYYSHVPFFGPEHLHEPFTEYEEWLTRKMLPHSAARFRDWVKNEYHADDPPADPPPLLPGPRHPI